MGSWGYTALEDDTVLDFIGEFGDSPSIELLDKTLQQAIDVEYIDDWVGASALAAAEVVAAINENPLAALDDKIKEWANSAGACVDNLKSSALMAVNKVFEESELREIWEDSDGLEQWSVAIEDLKSRLA